VLLLLSVNALAQGERSIWKIGDFDSSFAEFGTDSTATSRVFVISKSQPQDWFGTQQAVLPDKIGETTSRRIQFELSEAPQGIFKLKLGLIVLTPRLPLIQVDVNGHKGWFHQHPETDNREGNIEGAIFPQYSIGTLAIEIPSEFFGRAAIIFR
jgi:hypothetical protein